METPDRIYLPADKATDFSERVNKTDVEFVHAKEVTRLRAMIRSLGGDPNPATQPATQEHACKRCGEVRSSLVKLEMHLHFAGHKPKGYRFKKYKPNRKTATGEAVGLTVEEQQELLNAKMRGGV
jgi:hypothetical protein